MRVLIVDDEHVARRGLRRQLSALDGVECVGECGGRDAAVAAIVEQRPDVVLLDIQLGRATAFDIVEEVGVDAMPLVIFVTAYDRHALKAFEVHALDYVLKPVDPARLQDALTRAASQLARQRDGSLADRLEKLLSALPGRSTEIGAPNTGAELRSSKRFVARDTEGLLHLLDVERIDWFESMGNYVRVHAADRAWVMRATMDTVAQRLASNADFVRVRRSAVINVNAVAGIERYAKSAYLIRLRGGSHVISTRYYVGELKRLLAG
jgi:two-component system, LytTR family, response regulator